MPYLGVAPNPRQNREVDDISSSFNGSTTAFTLQTGGSNVSPGSDTAIIVSLGGVIQNPGTDYTIAASTITFTTAPASGLSFFGVVLAQSIDIETTADGTVTNAKVNASAAIAGTKISPDFGSQDIVTTGSVGIGIGAQTPSTPQKQLHIAHDSSPRIMLSNDTTGHAASNGTELLLDSDGNFEILQRENLNLEFFTSSSQRMTINGSGNVGIGTTSPQALGMHIYDATNTSSSREQFRISGGDRSSDNFETGFRFFTVAPSANGNRHMRFTANGNLGLTIQGHETSTGNAAADRNILLVPSGGKVGIGNSSPAEKLEVSYPNVDVGIVVSTTDTFSSGNSTLMQFREVNTVGGSIAFTNGGTTTAYVTSSDYRLKENVVTLTDAITRLKTLKPYRFNFIKTPDTTVDGFLAHELTAVPEAVTGEKDAMRKIKYTEEDELPEGKNVGDFKEYSTTEIDPQGVDYAKLTPLLTAALQEAITKIETLETKVAALE